MSNNNNTNVPANSLGNLTVNGNYAFQGTMVPHNINISLTLSTEEQEKCYKFDVGDLVTCTEGKYKGKVGKITRRHISTNGKVENKKIVSLYVQTSYDVDFDDKKDSSNPNSLYHLITYKTLPTIPEEDLELAFKQ